MKKFWKFTGILFTILITGLIICVYIQLEIISQHDDGCGCSSTCEGFSVSHSSKILGYGLLIFSMVLFIAAIWRIGKIRLWVIVPSAIILITTLYGNSYVLYDKIGCRLAVNQTNFFIFPNNRGDFAKAGGESLDFDSLKAGKYKEKLLGYYLDGDNLYVYRIGGSRIKIKTGFLFWQLDKDKIIKNFSYGLNSYFIPSDDGKEIELIGGMNMPEKAFLAELKFTLTKWDPNSIISKKIVSSNDGTTRFYLSIK